MIQTKTHPHIEQLQPTTGLSIFLLSLLPNYPSQNNIVVSGGEEAIILPAIADVVLPEQKTIYPGKNGRDWVFLPYRDEPDKGNYPLPRRTISRIQRLLENGVDFDDIWIAHEIPSGGQDYVPPPSPLGVTKSQWASHILQVLDGVYLPQISLAELLDPILFGCKYNDNGTATLYVIDVWEW